MVDSLFQTTDAVAPRDHWTYWKDTILPSVECRRLGGDAPFAARRSLFALSAGTVVDTVSSAIEVRRSAAEAARDGRDYATMSVFVAGHGAAAPENARGHALATGDIALLDIARAFTNSGSTTYRELRLYVPRLTFADRIGSIEDIEGLRIPADAPLSGLFTRYLQGFAEALPNLSRRGADAGLDGVLHLLSGLVASHTDLRHDDGEGASGEALVRLADRHIASSLGDPGLDVARLARAVEVSRTRLYGIYAGRGGVAAAIRDARLDRARARLTAPADRHRNLEQIAHLCGFRDYASFSRAFRRRFGAPPRDCRGG